VGLRALSRGKTHRVPRLAAGLRIYAIGDIHGRADLLYQVFSRIDAHRARNPVLRPVIVLVGDYIDRGPASREVLDLLIARKLSHEMVCLTGNHEPYLLEFLQRPGRLREWSMLGGRETLMSYGIKPPMNADAQIQRELADALNATIPKSHVRFLANLPSCFICGGFFFAHAGVRPGIPLDKQRDEDLLWIRDDFLLHEDDFGKIIVHGHTPVLELDIRHNRINIDTGAYATGRLTCLVIEGDSYAPL
jgi:serine/threonine protein phosphatase 1